MKFSLELIKTYGINFFEYSMFRNVKELFKSNQNWCASLTMCIKLEKENRLAVACLENKMKVSLELIKINGINFFRI